MSDNLSKINALLSLIDDPNEEVFQHVYNEIIKLDDSIIEKLEEYQIVEYNQLVISRLRDIITVLKSRKNKTIWKNWIENKGTLLEAFILINEYKVGGVEKQHIIALYNKLKQDIWLELNQFMSPLEQIEVINSIVYNYYRFEGVSPLDSKVNHFYISDAFNEKYINVHLLGIMLFSIFNELDVPFKCLQLPNLFLLGYYEIVQPFSVSEESKEVVYRLSTFLNPLHGSIMTPSEIEVFFKKNGHPMKKEYYLPLNEMSLVYLLLNEFKCAMEDQGNDNIAKELNFILKDVFEQY